MKIASEGDMTPTAGMHIDNSGAVIIEIDGILIGVLFTMHLHHDEVTALSGDTLLILKDAASEIETYSTTIRHIVSTAEKGQIGDDGVVGYSDRIRTGEVDWRTAIGVGTVDIDDIMTARETFTDPLLY